MAARTVSIYPSGSTAPGEAADYTDMSLMEAGEDGDLVTGTTTLQVNITESDGNWNTADTSDPTFDGWTTNATYDITITTLSDGARNPFDGTTNGTYSTSHYRLEETATHPFIVNNAARIDLTVDGVQTAMINSSANAFNFYFQAVAASSVIRIKACYMLHDSTHASGRVLYLNDSDLTLYYENCVFDTNSGDSNEHIHIAGVANCYITNCTFYNSASDSIECNGNNVYPVNCAMADNQDDFQDTFPTGYPLYCASDQGAGEGTSGVDISLTWNTTCFSDYTIQDFRVQDDQSPLYHAGEAPDNDSNIPSVDIAGTARPTGANQVSIGAFELAAANEEYSDTRAGAMTPSGSSSRNLNMNRTQAGIV